MAVTDPSSLIGTVTRLRRGLLFFSVFAVLLAVRTAYAHAELVAADPAPGAVVMSSPDMIWLEFSEPLRPGSDVALYGTDFRAVTEVEVVLDLTNPTRLAAILPELIPDNYTVQWTSVSIDGDTLSGSYAFGVREERSAGQWLWGLAVAAALLSLFAVFYRRRRSHVAAPPPYQPVDP